MHVVSSHRSNDVAAGSLWSVGSGDRRLQLRNATVVSDGRRLAPATLVVAGGRVRVASQAHRTPRGCDAGVDLDGYLVFPGLVNAHDHLHLNVFPPTRPRGRYDHSSDWIADMATLIETPALRRLRALPQFARAWHGALKNALAGTTTVVHHDPWITAFDAPDFPITVVREVGWAHSLVLDGRYGPPWRESLVGAAADRPWFIHLAEGTDARAEAELELLAAAGGLGPHTRLIHAVGLRPQDRARALAAGAGMIWCPASNAYLLGAVADPSDWAAAGRAALGTDARLTGSRDLLDELAFAAGTGLCGSQALLDMVTGWAAALCGRLEAGRVMDGGPADLLALRDDGRDPADQLVGARRADLSLVLARGRPLVAGPELAEMFDLTGQPAWPARLDGKPKLVSASLVRPLARAGIGEPGLEVEAASDV